MKNRWSVKISMKHWTKNITCHAHTPNSYSNHTWASAAETQQNEWWTGWLMIDGIDGKNIDTGYTVLGPVWHQPPLRGVLTSYHLIRGRSLILLTAIYLVCPPPSIWWSSPHPVLQSGDRLGKPMYLWWHY